MKKIIISLAVIGVVSAVIIGGTVAYFSDTETSTGNVFTAGAIDLKIDNESYYFGPSGKLEVRDDLSWDLDDLTGHLFFNYEDLKPGDWGEDTISLHVNNNDAWVCTDLYVTRNDDMSSSEPELEEGDDQENPQDTMDGELAQAVNFFFWVDDGDNVYEDDERLLIQGPASLAIGGLHYALADSIENNIGGQDGSPMEGEDTRWIGKIWCFGDLTVNPVSQDDTGPLVRHSGITCDGSSVNNMTQTDAMMIDLSFYATQARHNGNFVCDGAYYTPDKKTVLRLENKDDNWNPILGDGIQGELSFISANSTFDFDLEVNGLTPNTSYTLVRYEDPWPGTGSDQISVFTTDASGNATESGNIELNKDLINVKFWVILSDDWTGSEMDEWNQSEYLYEWNLVSYDDTEI